MSMYLYASCRLRICTYRGHIETKILYTIIFPLHSPPVAICLNLYAPIKKAASANKASTVPTSIKLMATEASAQRCK